jgi:hypothetical protein
MLRRGILAAMTTADETRPTARERALYHQVHPVKLATDVGTAVVSTVLLAQHELAAALAIMWLPSVVVSAALISWGDFAEVRRSRVGEYLRRDMTTGMQALRFAGFGVVALAAWAHVWALIPVGAGVILWGWFGKPLLARLR